MENEWEEVNSGEGVMFSSEGDTFIGKFVGVREGQYGHIYEFKDDNEKVRLVFGCAILDSRMSFVEIGESLKITYKGMVKTGTGRFAKNFLVQRKPNVKVEEVK